MLNVYRANLHSHIFFFFSGTCFGVRFSGTGFGAICFSATGFGVCFSRPPFGFGFSCTAFGFPFSSASDFPCKGLCSFDFWRPTSLGSRSLMGEYRAVSSSLILFCSQAFSSETIVNLCKLESKGLFFSSRCIFPSAM